MAALFTVAKMWTLPKCPSTEEQIKKVSCTHMMEYYSATKKRNDAICSNMHGPRDCHKVNSARQEKDRYHVTSLIHGI